MNDALRNYKFDPDYNPRNKMLFCIYGTVTSSEFFKDVLNSYVPLINRYEKCDIIFTLGYNGNHDDLTCIAHGIIGNKNIVDFFIDDIHENNEHYLLRTRHMLYSQSIVYNAYIGLSVKQKLPYLNDKIVSEIKRLLINDILIISHNYSDEVTTYKHASDSFFAMSGASAFDNFASYSKSNCRHMLFINSEYKEEEIKFICDGKIILWFLSRIGYNIITTESLL